MARTGARDDPYASPSVSNRKLLGTVNSCLSWGDIDPANPRDTIGSHKPKIPRSDLPRHDEL